MLLDARWLGVGFDLGEPDYLRLWRGFRSSGLQDFGFFRRGQWRASIRWISPRNQRQFFRYNFLWGRFQSWRGFRREHFGHVEQLVLIPWRRGWRTTAGGAAGSF